MKPETSALAIVSGPELAAEPGLGPLTMPGFLREVCARHRGREAMVFHAADGVRRTSYDQLLIESMRVARALVANGVGKDARVGLLATNRPEWVTGMFGITLTGATCVALSSFATPAELEQQLRLADVSVLLFERSVASRDFAADLLEICPELRACPPGELRNSRLPYLRRVVCLDSVVDAQGIATWPGFLRQADGVDAPLVEAMAAAVAPADHGLVFFSSGSTGKPKGILHSQRAAALQCWRWVRIFAIDPDVRTWSANGFFWSGNFCMGVGATLGVGGSLVLQRGFEPGEALRLMAAEKVTLPLAWPHQWGRLTGDPAYAGTDLSSLRYVGEASPLRQHPTVRADWNEPVAAFGNTEALTFCTVHPSGTPRAVREGNSGFALPGNTVRVVDPLSGEVLPRGAAGEIAIKGPTLMLGYLKMPLEEVFDAEGYFRTGDGGFIDDSGRLHWQGRLNDIIKTGGANVSPLEVDAVLAEYPGVKLARTVGVPHEALGEMVVACVVPAGGAELQEAPVREFVARRLSSYKVPRRVLFVAESELTLTGSNKVKLGALRELAAARLAPT
jgi:acyl-coenzyme A synthetase/AMP-(fatty) acid ligase